MDNVFHCVEERDELKVHVNEYEEVCLSIGGEWDCCSYRQVTLSLEDAKHLNKLLVQLINQLE